MSNAKKQLLNHLRETIKVGNAIITEKEWSEDDLNKYHECLQELIAFFQQAEGLNFLIEKKIYAIEFFDEQKDYDSKLNIFLKKILPPNKKASRKKNLDNYIKKQNLLLAAIEYYFKHEA
jgi:hypothetical protein